MGISPSLRSVRLWKNPENSGLIVFFWGQTLLRKTEYSGIFHNGSVSLPPAGSTLGFFSNIHCENLVELQEVKLFRSIGASLEFLSLRFAHIEPPGVDQLQFRFSYSDTDYYGLFCCSQLWFSIFSYWPIQFGGQWFSLWPDFSHGSKKRCWFFS